MLSHSNWSEFFVPLDQGLFLLPGGCRVVQLGTSECSFDLSSYYLFCSVLLHLGLFAGSLCHRISVHLFRMGKLALLMVIHDVNTGVGCFITCKRKSGSHCCQVRHYLCSLGVGRSLARQCNFSTDVNNFLDLPLGALSNSFIFLLTLPRRARISSVRLW